MQTSSRPVRSFLKLVTIEHSVFALPFALLAALSAMDAIGDRVLWPDLSLIVVAMVGARTFAMAANRIIDRRIDAANPRTAGRELVTGAVSLRTAAIGAGVSVAVFLVAAAALDPLCLALAPIAVAPLVIYPYGKRFTDLPHVILGVAQAVAPIGAWVAVTGSLSRPAPGPALWLALAVGTWIGGFDLIYASQDIESDRRNGVRSTPARFGLRASLLASRAAHVVTIAALIGYGMAVSASPWWWVGVAATAGAFTYEHSIVRPDDLSRVNRAFFTVNGAVGLVLMVFGVLDLAARGLAA